MSEKRAPGSNEKVTSPCTSICALNEEDVCVGCFRSAAEISQWGSMSVQQQRDVVALAQVRSKANNPFA